MTSYPIFSLSFSCHHITPSFSVSRPTLKAFPLVLLKKKGLNPLGFTGSLGFTLSNRSTVLAGKENEETMRDRPKHLLYRVLGLSEKCQQGLARAASSNLGLVAVPKGSNLAEIHQHLFRSQEAH